MEGANLVYNKYPGSGAAIRLNPDTRVRDDIFNRTVAGIEQEKLDKERRQEQLYKLMGDFDATGGFPQDNDAALHRINTFRDNMYQKVQDSGGLSPELAMEFQENSLKEAVLKSRREQDKEYFIGQVKQYEGKDFDTSSMEELKAWSAMDPIQRAEWEDANGGRPKLKPFYNPTVEDLFKGSMYDTAKIDAKVEQRGRASTTKPVLADLSVEGRSMGERAYNALYNPNASSSDKYQAQVAMAYDMIENTGALNGLEPGTGEHKEAFIKGLSAIGDKYYRDTNKFTEKDIVGLPPSSGSSKPQKPIGWSNGNYSSGDWIFAESDSPFYPFDANNPAKSFVINRDDTNSKDSSGQVFNLDYKENGENKTITGLIRSIDQFRGEYYANVITDFKGNDEGGIVIGSGAESKRVKLGQGSIGLIEEKLLKGQIRLNELFDGQQVEFKPDDFDLE